jgi:hypothetical protein
MGKVVRARIIWYLLAERLPMPRWYRMRWLRKQINFSVARNLESVDAAEKHTLRLIWQNWTVLLATLSDDEDAAFSEDLLRRAHKLRVPIPPYIDLNADAAPEASAFWTKTSITEATVLSEVGIAKIRDDIRVEERWRMEKRAHWFAFFTTVAAPIIGVIGAVTGLIAVLHKAKGG